uniref:Uncharacterized protein n=1 Tax=Gallus gallus TaxID=9031 RepID=A0A8V0X6Q9_CHICK
MYGLCKTFVRAFPLLCFPSACDRPRKRTCPPTPASNQNRETLSHCGGNHLCIPVTNPCFSFLSFHYCFRHPASHPPA